MKNFVQDGEILSLFAPYDVSAGDGFKIGAIFAVAVCDALQDAPVEGVTEGVFILKKTAAQAWSAGDKIYWDDVNKRCDKTGNVGMLIGTATEDAANPSATGYVQLNEACPDDSTGPQPAIADIATADANDLASAEALANANKAKINAILAALRAAGILLP